VGEEFRDKRFIKNPHVWNAVLKQNPGKDYDSVPMSNQQMLSMDKNLHLQILSSHKHEASKIFKEASVLPKNQQPNTKQSVDRSSVLSLKSFEDDLFSSQKQS